MSTIQRIDTKSPFVGCAYRGDHLYNGEVPCEDAGVISGWDKPETGPAEIVER
jgi:hypothetical protein